MHDLKPTRFGEKYILLDLIGAGGVAEVFRGKLTRDKGFEKVIVIKKLLAEYSSDREMVDIFIREARLAALLQHDNIAATYDFGEIDGEYFLAMEYLSGKNLHSFMSRARDHEELFGLVEALIIGSKICEGMEYAHNLTDLQHRPLSIVHRDLTPHNIFVTYDGKVKILDFGVAKAELFDNKTREGVVKGKVSYMSPERLSGDEVDSRSDIFSIGILLYEMISGRRMYQGDTAELIRKCLTAEYEELRSLVPNLDPSVYRIVDRALAVDIDLRYPNCSEMQSDIDDFLFRMQLPTGSHILRKSVRALFDREYESEHRKFLKVLSLDGEGGDRHGDSNRSGKADREAAREEPASDKTALLLHRPPKQVVKLYSARLVRWGAEKYQPLQETVREAVAGLPVGKTSLVAAAALVATLLVIFALTGSDQEEPTKPAADQVSAVPDQTEEKPSSGSVKEPPAAQGEGEPLSAADESGEELQGSAQAKVKEGKPTEVLPDPDVEAASEALEKAVERESPARTIARDTTKVPVLKVTESKRKKVVAAASAPTVAVNPPASPRHREVSEVPVEIGNQTLSFEENLEQQAKRKKLDLLHLSARKAMQQGNLIQPAQYNAHAYFSEILLLDPQDQAAADGLELICDKYLSLAEQSLAVKEYNQAEKYAQDGLTVQADYPRLVEIKKRITREREEHIFELSEKARLCLAADKLSTPANDSAYFYYNEIARLDPDNELVPIGWKKIADRYATLAEEAFREFDYKAAEIYVRRGLLIDPDHYYLLSLNRELARNDLGKFGHSLKKKLNKMFTE